MGTARGPRAPVKRLPVSALHLFCQVGGAMEAIKSEFLQSHGAALTPRVAVGVLTRSTVGTCQVIGPYGFVFFFWGGSINY